MPRREKPHDADSINIRYTPKTKRVNMLVAEHYQQARQAVARKNGEIDQTAMLDTMGISGHRWNAILAGGECTIGELVTYAKHFNVPISKLYSTINN